MQAYVCSVMFYNSFVHLHFYFQGHEVDEFIQELSGKEQAIDNDEVLVPEVIRILSASIPWPGIDKTTKKK